LNKLEKISVVGGGTAGLVAALILKTRFPSKKIQIIRSEKIGIIGVGEGSTEHWNEFMNYIGLNFKDIIKNCDATFKSGIMFQNWHDKDYLHSIGPEHEIINGQYRTYYGKVISHDWSNKELNPLGTWENTVDQWHLDNDSPYNQFHFNTQKLNDYLHLIAEQKGINILDDEIKDVVLDTQGDISYIVGEKTNYASDFFIDCTGFKRLLINKLGAKWNSYSKYLKMKSAIVFPTEQKQEIDLWTTARAMDYGWMFTIPVWDRCGNGYIFDSDYITADQAQQEVEELLGKKINVGKHLKFDPGALDKVWINNCCAIGLSASFVEPLEATSIGTSINQAFLLMHRLPNYTKKSIDEYNKQIEIVMHNIRDFVALHYVTNKDHNQFWKDIKNVPLPEDLSDWLDHWKNNLPILEDFIHTGSYALFKDPHFIQILAGLELFDRNSLLAEYDMLSDENRKLADGIREERRILGMNKVMIGHKEFLARLRAKE
jgi:flavin-dependent dehydrogenase